MKLWTTIALAAGIGALSTAAVAQQRSFAGNGQPACLSEELLDQLITASVDNDQRAIEYLLGNGCIVPKSGVPVSVLDRSWTGTSHVRVYTDNGAFELWTVNEALTD
ncbi:hypothetical protein [Halomonas sp. HG01]|uniref:hypothetical protein n=1 Tax=Halomonas sp. HG01 TaxID=1609967 RepID=UPI0006147612|nr:hypothetical protein [Halomonas sp. HG01]